MKLTARVTLITPDGQVPPGEVVDIRDKAEAQCLIARGFATAAPAPEKHREVVPPPTSTDDGDLLA